jgi:hypothetical protein
MRDAVLGLERLGDETRRCFERDHRHSSWFQDWEAIPECISAATDVSNGDEPHYGAIPRIMR